MIGQKLVSKNYYTSGQEILKIGAGKFITKFGQILSSIMNWSDPVTNGDSS